MTTWSMSSQMSLICFILCKQANLIEENVSGQWEIHFDSVLLFKDRAVC